MWELVDDARWFAARYREQARRHPHDPYYREQVLRHLTRARNFLIRTRGIEDAIRRAQS
jgi:hypothetical protein